MATCDTGLLNGLVPLPLEDRGRSRTRGRPDSRSVTLVRQDPAGDAVPQENPDRPAEAIGVFRVPRIQNAPQWTYRRGMTIAGVIVTFFVVPLLLGQVIYALTRGKPTSRELDHPRS